MFISFFNLYHLISLSFVLSSYPEEIRNAEISRPPFGPPWTSGVFSVRHHRRGCEHDCSAPVKLETLLWDGSV